MIPRSKSFFTPNLINSLVGRQIESHGHHQYMMSATTGLHAFILHMYVLLSGVTYERLILVDLNEGLKERDSIALIRGLLLVDDWLINK